MTNIWNDGFDFLDPTIWTGAGSVAAHYVSDTPRTGPHCVRLNANPPFYRDFTTVEEDDGMFVGLGILLGLNNTSTFKFIQLFEAQGATEHIWLECNGSSRGYRIVRGDGTVLIDVLPNVIVRETWHYVELGVKIANSGGSVELRQDGATIAIATGIDTQNGGTNGLIDRVQFLGPGFGEFRIDDIYVNNEQVNAGDNADDDTFWGDTRHFPIYPNGNGFYSQLLGSDGNSVNNYQQVDEVGAASTADFNSSATDGNKDTYAFEDLPVSVGTVRAVEIRVNAEKSDVGNKAIRTVVRRSGTDAFGSDIVLAEDDAPYRQVYAQDPIAAAAWTISNVNATEIGAEVQDF
jgi:hypothetical protein